MSVDCKPTVIGMIRGNSNVVAMGRIGPETLAISKVHLEVEYDEQSSFRSNFQPSLTGLETKSRIGIKGKVNIHNEKFGLASRSSHRDKYFPLALTSRNLAISTSIASVQSTWAFARSVGHFRLIRRASAAFQPKSHQEENIVGKKYYRTYHW